MEVPAWLLWGGTARDLHNQQAGARPLGKQSRGELAPAISTTGVNDASRPADANIVEIIVEICLCSCLDPRSLQPRTQPPLPSAPISSRTVPLLSPSGAAFAPNKRRFRCPIRDQFAFV